MDPSQQLPESPEQPLASYTDGIDHSWPATPVTATIAGQDPHIGIQVDGLSRSNSLVSPLSSPMTYKPTKRKRLAKACDACHRSKRRCDGTALCANCEFAGKACTYTDPSGRVVPPPRSGRAPRRRYTLEDPWTYSTVDAGAEDLDQISLRMATPVPTTSDTTPSPLDPTLTKELVNYFFAYCHPVTFIVHRPNFLHDLARSKVPGYLLFAILAVAAPYSRRPSLRTGPPWYAGEGFANQATKILFNDEQPHMSSISESLCVKPCLELAQTLCLLQHHESVMRRQSRSNRFLALAKDVLDALQITTIDLTPIGATYAEYVRNEIMRRVLWYIYHTELLFAVMAQTTLPTLAEPLSQIRLPVEEALFDMPRVENRLGIVPSYHYLALQAESKVCASEFGNLVRVSCIYASAMNAVTQKGELNSFGSSVPLVIVPVLLGISSDRTCTPRLEARTEFNARIMSFGSLEVDLRTWLELLPDHLRLTEDNLQVYISQLDCSGAAAWAFCYMHMLAESTVLALHEFANLGTDKDLRLDSPRATKAIGNLTMIMGSMGQRARTNFTMAALLVTLGKHTALQVPHISWFDEYQHQWGISYDQLMSAEFHSTWASVSTSTVEDQDKQTQNLHLDGIYNSQSDDLLFNYTKLGEERLGSERLGTLAAAAVVEPVHPASSVMQGTIKGLINRRQAGNRLSSIVTNGLSGRQIERQLYGEGPASLSDGRGESEGSEYPSLDESPTTLNRPTAATVQLHVFDTDVHTQAMLTSDRTQIIGVTQYHTQTSVLQYTNQGHVANSDLSGGTGLNWLEDGGT